MNAKIYTQMPQIGRIVYRVTPKGLQKDWCFMNLYIVGKDAKGHLITESGVVCWGSSGERYDKSENNNWVECYNGQPVVEPNYEYLKNWKEGDII